MLRSRVRRSFTVEVKSKSRQAPSWPETASPAPVNWAALDPAPETASPDETLWTDAPKAAPVPSEKPRRILPSLIVAEPEPEAPEPVVVREPRLPRVRRVKLPLAAGGGPRAAPSWSFADIAGDAPEPAVQAAPSWQAPAPGLSVANVPAAPARKLANPRVAEPTLRPGERWKRRLPRSCR